jgi:hypothetical protein
MPITQIDIDDATNVIDELLGNQDEAEAYSQDPEGWLTEHGYDGLNPEAVAQCGASASAGGGAAVAASGASAAAGASGASAVAAVLNPVVYNHYYEVDNSITNNIENNGDLDFNQQVGDGNVNIDDSVVEGDVQTQTGDGIQFGGDVSDSNLASGDDNQQAIDQSTNVEGDLDQHTDINVDDHSIGDGSLGQTTDNSSTVQDQDIDVDAV